MEKSSLIALRSKIGSFVSKNSVGSFLSSLYLRSKNAPLWNRTAEIQKTVSECLNYGKIVAFNADQKLLLNHHSISKRVYLSHTASETLKNAKRRLLNVELNVSRAVPVSSLN